jgi:hypothetical protein
MSIKQWFWTKLTAYLCREDVFQKVLLHAHKHPYTHLEGYMHRFWVFNAYNKSGTGAKHRERAKYWFLPFLPSVRIHHILRADNERHMHDHPWNARSIIARGSYQEERLEPNEKGELQLARYFRTAGSSATLNFGEYHKIVEVSPNGVWTIFFTWRYRGKWGFLDNGVKVPWDIYLAREQDNAANTSGT